MLVSGALTIDMEPREMTPGGRPLEATASAAAVLFVLARHAAKPVPRERLLRVVWGSADGGRLRDLQAQVARLRRKRTGRAGCGILLGHGRAGYSLAPAAPGVPAAPGARRRAEYSRFASAAKWGRMRPAHACRNAKARGGGH